MGYNVNEIRKEEGFTLVELAVVMIIIGVLIGGILKGQELITNARVTTTASQFESLGAAYNTFRDQFNALPGDMGNGGTRIAGCDGIAACNLGTTAGDLNNGVIDVVVGGTPAGEGITFFGHLLGAGMITGMDGSGTTAAMGVTNPSANIGGGFMVGDTREGAPAGFAATGELTQGHYLILNGVADAVDGNGGAVTGNQAANIDRRIDDGNALTGSVISDNGANCRGNGTPDAGGNPTPGTSYDLTNVGANCALAYKM